MNILNYRVVHYVHCSVLNLEQKHKDVWGINYMLYVKHILWGPAFWKAFSSCSHGTIFFDKLVMVL